MASFRTSVEPSVLKWAREAVNLTVPDAAKKASVKPELLEAWEDGSDSPLYNQLEKLAKVYKRPIAVLYLRTPPGRRFDTLKDFRRSLEAAGMETPYELITALDRVRRQQDALTEIYEADDIPFPRIDFQISPTDDIETTATRLRAWIGLQLSDQSKWARTDVLMPRLVELVEDRDILVTQVQHVDVGTMRGCALSDHAFPAIVINGADAPAAKPFTLLHELVHVVLRKSGQSVVPVTTESRIAVDRIERFCNSLAAATLMDKTSVESHAQVVKTKSLATWSVDRLNEMSSDFGVSPEAMMIRLITLKKASWENYEGLRSEFRGRRERWQADERAKRKASDTKPPLYYQLKARDLGKKYIREVLWAYDRNDITSADLTEYLGLKIGQVPKIRNRVNVAS